MALPESLPRFEWKGWRHAPTLDGVEIPYCSGFDIHVDVASRIPQVRLRLAARTPLEFEGVEHTGYDLATPIHDQLLKEQDDGRTTRQDQQEQEEEPLIDPDCRAGKHRTCIGGPCECRCHRPVPDDGALRGRTPRDG